MMMFDYILRLFIAGILGAIVGLEREYRAKEAGFRTHFLVAFGSALFMIVSKYGFEDILESAGVGLDPSRIASQVVTGIGFLGAGTIMIQKRFVRGLTTAAGVWVTAAIGLAVGAGLYWTGICSVALTLLGLEGLGYLFRKFGLRSVLVVFSTTNKDNLKLVTDELEHRGHMLVNYNSEIGTFGEQVIYRVSIVFKTRCADDESLLFQYMQHLPDMVIERME